MTTSERAYDYRCSLTLNRIVIALELGPPAVQKLALRLAKRYMERAVPPFVGKAGAR